MKKGDLRIITQWLERLCNDEILEKEKEVNNLPGKEAQWNRLSCLLIREKSVADHCNNGTRLFPISRSGEHLHCAHYKNLYIEQKAKIYEARNAKLRYYLFWPVTILGLFGGFWALYQLLKALFGTCTLQV